MMIPVETNPHYNHLYPFAITRLVHWEAQLSVRTKNSTPQLVVRQLLCNKGTVRQYQSHSMLHCFTASEIIYMHFYIIYRMAGSVLVNHYCVDPQ